jgi:DNA-binding protein HU-beta
MNKAQLIEKIATKTQQTKSTAEDMIDAALEIIQNTVAKGEEVKLVGFGTFAKSRRKARKGRNPQTGEAVNLPATNVPRFRAGKDFREKANKIN